MKPSKDALVFVKPRRKNRVVSNKFSVIGIMNVRDISEMALRDSKNITPKTVDGEWTIRVFGNIARAGAVIDPKQLSKGINIADQLLENFEVLLYDNKLVVLTDGRIAVVVACLREDE